MIHSNIHLIYLLAGFLAFISCSDEELVNPYKGIEEGIPVTASLSFGTSGIVKIETKSTTISDDVKLINSLAILVFKNTESGMVKVKDTEFFSSEDFKNQSISVHTTSGKRYIYAVANYKSSLFNLESELQNISTLDDLKRLTVKLPENNLSVLDGQFLMSGWFVPDKDASLVEEGACSINSSGTILTPGKIDLKHIMASIEFNVSCGKEDATFVADSWQVKNVPQRSNLIEQSDSDYSGNDDDYLPSESNTNFDIDMKRYTFSFLMMENRKKPKGTPSSRDEREKMSETSENFSIANEHSTYVVLKGTYDGMTKQEVNGDADEKYVKAYTTYFVHLGDWSGNEADRFSNFDIFRNNSYVYKVSIVSVDSLIVEVEKKREVSGADGDMYLSTSKVRNFDAHYETTVISFSKEKIKKLVEEAGGNRDQFIKNFQILSSTPENNFTPSDIDLGWVTFKRNDKGYTGFMKYEGNTEKDSELLTTERFKGDLFDVYTSDLFDDNDSIRYTCFIDEYYYDNMKLSEFVNQQPRTLQICTYYNKSEQPNTSSIKMAEYVFTQRSICTVYDLDKLDVEKSVNGWGTEWVQEGNNMPTVIEAGNNHNSFIDTDKYNNEHFNNSLSQGRQNMVTQLGTLGNWDNYVNYENNDMMDSYKYAEYACLSRNRDLNGNGTLDEDEIRWYLPAINQYMGFSMGEDVLPKEARLFTGSTYDPSYIFTSNTVVNRAGTVYRHDYDTEVFWACEGSSIGFFKDGHFDKYPQKPYRCIRNLRSVSSAVDDYLVPSKQTWYDKSLIHDESPIYDWSPLYIDFTYLNPKSMRKQVSWALTPYHKNTDEENRLFEGLEIGVITKDQLSENYKSILLNDAVHSNPCQELGEGWRLPNQRELTIMTSHIITFGKGGVVIEGEYAFEENSLASCTMAKYPNWIGQKYYNYHVYDGAHNISLIEGTTERAYRCVKDKKMDK